MRKGLTLALVAVVSLLLVGTSFAEAPIFTDVPGVIVISDEAVDGQFETTGVLVYDEAATDPQDDSLEWTFEEYNSGTILEINGVGGGAGAINVGATMDVDDTTNNTGGVAAAVTAAYAGTSAADLLASAGMGTTITLSIDDGVNVTSMDVLVCSIDGTVGSTAGVSTNQATYTDAASYTGWLGFQALNTNGLTESEDAGLSAGLSVYSNLPHTSGIALEGAEDELIDAVLWSFYLEDFTLPAGKMLRVATDVTAVNNPNGDNVTDASDPLRHRVRFSQVQTHVASGGPIFHGSYSLVRDNPDDCDNNLSPFGGALRAEMIVSPPVEVADAFNTDTYDLYFDMIDLGGDQINCLGGLVFSNTVVDTVDHPEAGSNGYLKAYGTVESPYVLDSVTTDTTVFDDEWGVVIGELIVVQGITGRTVTPAGSVIDWTQSGDAIAFFMGTDVFGFGQWDTPDAATDADKVTYGDSVWYRCIYTISSNTTADQGPAMRIRLGNSWNAYNMTELETNATQMLSPTTSPTSYEVWFKGVASGLLDTQDVYNDIKIGFDVIDLVPQTATYTMDNTTVEIFPAAMF
jgi:hypothetical protein